ncbi:MAG: hypothetical protein V1914_01820 [archaeon]
MNKKGDVEMIETIMVLVVVIVLLMIGIVFYFKTSAASIEETGIEVCQLGGNDLLLAVTSMPELQCSLDTITERDCIDLDKVASFQALMNDKDLKSKYESFFSGTCPKKIKIELLYPEPETNDECQIGEEVGSCRTWVVFTPKQQSASKQMISTPISIYSAGSYYVGRIVVEINK